MTYKQKDFVKVDGKLYFIFYVMEDPTIYVGIEAKQRLNQYDPSTDKGFENIVLDRYLVSAFTDAAIESQFVPRVDRSQFYDIIEAASQLWGKDMIHICEGVDKALFIPKNELRLQVEKEMKDQDFCHTSLGLHFINREPRGEAPEEFYDAADYRGLTQRDGRGLYLNHSPL